MSRTMHRFWADAMAQFGDPAPYEPDDLNRQWVWKAMDVFDDQLGRVADWAEQGDRVVIVASSMGQSSIPYRHTDHSFVVTDPKAFAQKLGLGGADPSLAMYPAYSYTLETSAAADASLPALESMTLGDEPFLHHVRATGSTVRFDIACPALGSDVDKPVQRDGHQVNLAEYGIERRRRLGGGNTAHHVPHGTFFMFGRGIVADEGRREIPLTSVKGLVLDLLGATPSVASAA